MTQMTKSAGTKLLADRLSGGATALTSAAFAAAEDPLGPAAETLWKVLSARGMDANGYLHIIKSAREIAAGVPTEIRKALIPDEIRGTSALSKLQERASEGPDAFDRLTQEFIALRKMQPSGIADEIPPGAGDDEPIPGGEPSGHQSTGRSRHQRRNERGQFDRGMIRHGGASLFR